VYECEYDCDYDYDYHKVEIRNALRRGSDVGRGSDCDAGSGRGTRVRRPSKRQTNRQILLRRHDESLLVGSNVRNTLGGSRKKENTTRSKASPQNTTHTQPKTRESFHHKIIIIQKKAKQSIIIPKKPKKQYFRKNIPRYIHPFKCSDSCAKVIQPQSPTKKN